MKSKLNNPFKTLVLLMTRLIFGSPLNTFTQQNTAILQAKAAAEKDAKRHVKKLAWFGAGLISPVMSIAGCIGGVRLGAVIDPSDDSGLLYFSFSDGEILGALVGVVVVGSIPLIIAYYYRINLPPEQFIGKSPEYIEHYTDAYRKKARSIRQRTAVAGGVLSGCLIGLAIAINFIR